MKQLTKHNINDHIYFKLTDYGKRQLLATKRFASPQHLIYQTYRDGFNRLQVWEFMAIFGEYLYMGGDPPFDGTFWIEAT